MQCIRFEDADAYERGMAPWSRLAGQTFLEWLAPRRGLQWLDIGCGTGTFAGLIEERCAPIEVQGVDPSEAQLAIARMRCGGRFQRGDAMALPFEPTAVRCRRHGTCDLLRPEPRQRRSRNGSGGPAGRVGCGLCVGRARRRIPFDPIWQEIRAAGVTPLLPPSPFTAETETLRSLWISADFGPLRTRAVVVERTFSTFEQYWTTSTITGGVRPSLEAMSSPGTR